ncbi:unnamed protein product [Adineta steineri]|uniref:G-protein coupled receptors family 1 profile domain-containing protein n=3 Tax=Adineta steineri TaxID=433720 RepID=A0A819ZF43_9BILA|nr:unnamed protein product [Adineta steineri]
MSTRIIWLRNNNDSELLNNNTNTTTTTISDYRYIKLIILLSCQTISILCSLFIFVNIIHQPLKFIKPIGNHFIFVLLITSFIQVTTELSMVESYLRTGIVQPSNNSYCLFFNWYEFSLNGISLFVMFWATIERHILIFTRSIYQIRWKFIVFHYLPLSIATLYTPIFYGYVIFIYNCTNNWDYYELLCTSPCFYQNKILGSIDWLMNIIIPAFSIVLVNLILIIRVTCRSVSVRITIQRKKKNRKMTVQLLVVSSLFLIFWLPIAITGLIQQYFSPTFLIDIQFNIFFYLIYLIQLFLPFVCLISLPELKKEIRVKLHKWRRRNLIIDGASLQMATIG